VAIHCAEDYRSTIGASLLERAGTTEIVHIADGFSGWVGPEPHGASLSDSGLRRDPLLADRLVAWLEDRYARRRAGDAEALRPFLLVASFVNPHDIVLFPAWVRRMPLKAGPMDPPHVAEAPTQHEDLSHKPAAQIAFRESYPAGTAPLLVVGGPRFDEQATAELGVDRIFGRGTTPGEVASYLVHALADRKDAI